MSVVSHQDGIMVVDSDTAAVRPKSLLVFALLLLVGCASAAEGPLVDRRGVVVQRVFLPHSNASDKKVELLWTHPAGDGPWPAVLFIHGHQEVRDGAEAYVKTGQLGAMAHRGYVAAAISQPGYGHSDGPADFCGPFTQDAVLTAIAFLRKQAFVNPKKTALYGYSRGAIVASMVATQDQTLAAVILGGGAYDFFKWYPTPLRGIDTNIQFESGLSDEAFKARSAMYHAEKIKSPILLLHGTSDERVPVRQAEAFAAKLEANHIPLRIKLFPGAGHRIPLREQYREIYPFLKEFLR
jgi:dipeptidyl aminopeptidase/acylaminoacyl peptidase